MKFKEVSGELAPEGLCAPGLEKIDFQMCHNVSTEDAQSLFLSIINAPGSDLQIFRNIITLLGVRHAVFFNTVPPCRSSQWVALPDESRLAANMHSRKFGSSCCICLERSKVIIITGSFRDIESGRYKLQSGFCQFLPLWFRNTLAGIWKHAGWQFLEIYSSFLRFMQHIRPFTFLLWYFTVASVQKKKCSVSFSKKNFTWWQFLGGSRNSVAGVAVSWWFIETTLAGWVSDFIYVV